MHIKCRHSHALEGWYMQDYVYVCIYVCRCTYMYVSIHVCKYVYVYVHEGTTANVTDCNILSASIPIKLGAANNIA